MSGIFLKWRQASASDEQEFSDKTKVVEADTATVSEHGVESEPSEITDESDDFGLKIDPNIPDGGWRAWSQVLGSWCAIVATFGVASATGTLHTWLKENRLSHKSSSSIGWMFSVQIFLMYFGGIQVGPIFDAYGARVLLIPGCIGWTVSIFVLSWCKEYYQFVLGYSILGGLSSMFIFNPCVTVLSHWFSAHRGLAIGAAATGSAIGGILFPEMLNKLLTSAGYGWAVRAMAFIVLFLCAVAVLTLRSRHKISSINWEEARPDFSALMRKEFAACVVGLFLVEWGIFVPQQYIISYAIANGLSASEGNNLLAYMNTASFFSRILVGEFADVVGNFNAMIVSSALSGIMCLAVWLPAGKTEAGVTAFAVIFGFFSGAVISLTLIVVPSLAQVKNAGRRYGTAYMIASFAVLTGIPLAGALTAHNYLGVILFSGLVYICGAVSFAFCRFWAVGRQLVF